MARVNTFFFPAKYVLLILLLTVTLAAAKAQERETPFLKLVSPVKEQNTVSSTRQFIVGGTCKTCVLTINGEPVKVQNSGGFAYEVTLTSQSTDSTFTLTTKTSGKKSITKKVAYTVTPVIIPGVVATPGIESIQTIPGEDIVLRPGDKIRFKVKAFPGAAVSVFGNTPLYELPADMAAGLKGIYQGEYTVRETDSFARVNIPVRLVTADSQVIIKSTPNRISVISALASDVAVTTGRLAHLEYGLGTDRLGGAKIGYLDSLVQLRIIGKIGSDYKVKLAEHRAAYIPEDQVRLLPRGSGVAQSLTGSWSVYGDSTHDYVSVSLSARLPYQSFQELNPSKIVVDIFGATNNSNWIAQLNSVKEIDHVDYEQVADDIFRVKIQLKHAQHWGHQVYYRGNSLVIKIKHQPKDLSLSALRIAVDAGHGGQNTGAGGPTGSSEKNIALAVALKLQQILTAEGARVQMTRVTEKQVDNKDRILMYRDSIPDLLVSIHLNSASDPIRASGTSTHYRYVGNKKLSTFINERMQELGLKQYGVIGSFNFMLNSATEYPNVLVETLFLSNPVEEALILDESFQQQMADKILQGIKDFLADAAK